MILDGKALATSIRGDLTKLVREYDIKPCLAIVTVGNDPASKVYVRNKIKACEEIGIRVEHVVFASEITERALLGEIRSLNSNVDIHGIIVQLPLPKHINPEVITKAIWRSKDVDGFGQDSLFHPCTPEGIIRLLDHHLIDVSGKLVTVIGRSDIVGKPLAKMLLNRDATVIQCHSKTKKADLLYAVTGSDIIISACGVPNIVSSDYCVGKVIVDVGINRGHDGKIRGDFPPVAYEVASAYTPVPGGVGPMTVAMLCEHVVQAAIWQKESNYAQM